MAGRRIAITIRADGTVEAETLGITGEDCLDYLRLLEDLLDAEVVDSAFTSDYERAAVATDATTQVDGVATETVRERGTP
ncbi:MAG: DUF2997 domain-containing protein [Sporichthyaceae bacterium]|jgi:hypothetical protein